MQAILEEDPQNLQETQNLQEPHNLDDAGSHESPRSVPMIFKAPDTADDRLLAYLAPSGASEWAHEIKSALISQGYVVLKGIVSSNECKALLGKMWDYVEATSYGQISRQNLSSCYPPNDDPAADPWPASGWKSFPDMFQSADSGYVLGDLRLMLAERVFEPLFGTRELHTSKEGFTFHRPRWNHVEDQSWNHPCYHQANKIVHCVCGKPQPLSSGEHLDQDAHHLGLHCIQSLTSLIDQSPDEDDGHFVVYPSSHLLHPRITHNTYRGNFPSVPLNNDDIQLLLSHGHVKTRIYCNAGDVVLWRSDLVHAAGMPGPTCPNFRAVAYVSACPAALTPPTVYPIKMDGYRMGRTTDHRAHVEAFHDSPGESLPPPHIVGKRPKGKTKGSYNQHKNKLKHGLMKVTTADDGDGDGDDLSNNGSNKVSNIGSNNLSIIGINNISNNGSNNISNNGSNNNSNNGSINISNNGINNISNIGTNNISNNDEPPCNGECTQTNTNSCPAYQQLVPTDPFYHRFGPPKLSWRLAELYGVVPYHVPDKLHAIRSALVRGIRFDDSVLTPDVRQSLGLLDTNDIDDAVDEQLHAQLCRKPSQAKAYILDSPPLMGQDKWLGGMASSDGEYVYGVPGTATQVLSIHVETATVQTIGPHYKGEFKWLRGLDIPPSVFVTHFPDYAHLYPKGSCLALPSNASTVLEINPATQQVSTFGGPFEGTWMWHGGCLSPTNGCVYAIPANADRVLRIDPARRTTSLVGPVLPGDKQKWYGGLRASNGCIYGIPQNAAGIIKITPGVSEKDDLVEIFGNHLLHEGDWKWHGGAITRDGNLIYGFPNNAAHVLKIDTRTDTITLLDMPIIGGGHRVPHDGKYKYLGGAIANDFCLYLFPCEAERVLRICTRTDKLTLVGPRLTEGGSKFQNGFCSKIDGAVYAIPQRSRGVLRITPGQHVDEEPRVEMIYCGDLLVSTKDKFEGGVLGPKDGAIYCIPLRAKRVVKVVPAGPQESLNDK